MMIVRCVPLTRACTLALCVVGCEQVSSGMELIQRLGSVQTDKRTDRPTQEVKVLRASCLE